MPRLKKQLRDQAVEDNLNRHTGILTLTTTAGLLLLASILPSAHAYGSTAQWQVGFSGTCNVPTVCGQNGGPGTSGFWGWCEFGGSDGSSAPGTRGTSGDCQVTHYDRASLGLPNNPTHVAVDITGWAILPSAMGPPFSFHITAYTVECTGPGATLPFSCGIPPNGDTGIPPVAGHFAFSPFPGAHIDIQVNQLP